MYNANVIQYRCNEGAETISPLLQKGRIMRISTTKHNEVNPAELKKLFENGAKLIKSPYAIGVCIGIFKQINGKKVKVYSDDDIQIYNVTLPLSINGLYDCELNINECK